MRTEKVHNESPQEERRAIAENDQRVRARGGATFSSFAIGESDLVGGRYGAISKTNVTAASPTPRYPAQPVASPWNAEQPVEPPLGYDIEQAPIVGEAFEVENSMREASAGTAAKRPSNALPGEWRSADSLAALEPARRFSKRRKG